ncbi:MAG: response regulator [Burkholderiales bacterium]
MLYVEDHADSVALMEQLLADGTDLLLRAENANQAIELARAKRPEVILLNVDPPGPSGDLGAIAFMKLLRTQTATQTTPILALSANATPEAVVKGLEAGFFQYLAKPVQAKPLMEALAYALEFAAVERSEQAGPPPRRRPQPSKESR